MTQLYLKTMDFAACDERARHSLRDTAGNALTASPTSSPDVRGEIVGTLLVALKLESIGEDKYERKCDAADVLRAIDALPTHTAGNKRIPMPAVVETLRSSIGDMATVPGSQLEDSQTMLPSQASQSEATFGPEAQYPPGETPYSSAPSQESVPSQSQQRDTPASQGKKRPVPKTPPKAKAKDTGGTSPPRRKKAKKAVEAEEAAEAEAADDDEVEIVKREAHRADCKKKLEDLKKQAAKADDLEQEIAELTAENEKLKKENAQLKKDYAEYENMFE